MMRFFALLAVLLSAGMVPARADGADPIETRQAGQDLVIGNYILMRAVVAAKGDVKTLANPARAIARWMRQFPTQFPKGSEQGHDTRALPAVWSDWDNFQKTAGQLVDAATKLSELAKSVDADAVAAQVKAVGEVCDTCHRLYRAR